MNTQMKVRLSIAIFGFLFCFACMAEIEPETVFHVDLEKYQGKWYEIAKIPASFQKKCVRGTTAEYTIKTNGKVEVQNSCIQKNGFSKLAKGEAKVVDPETNSKLRVTFVNFFGSWIYAFGGDYWILDLDENYRYVVIGHPKKSYAWILSRESFIENSTLKRLSIVLAKNGYDICSLVTTVQENGFTEETPLCEVVKKQP